MEDTDRYTQQFATLVSTGMPLEEVLASLRASGASPVDAVRALRTMGGVRLSEAKALLVASPAWEAEVSTIERVQERLQFEIVEGSLRRRRTSSRLWIKVSNTLAEITRPRARRLRRLLNVSGEEIAVRGLPDSTYLGLQTIESIGGIEHIQVAHISVRRGDIEQEHLLVNPHSVRPDRATCDALTDLMRSSYPDVVISILLGDSLGKAEMFASDASPDVIDIAAAVSLYKASWGWDESYKFRVRVNDRKVLLRVIGFEPPSWKRFEARLLS